MVPTPRTAVSAMGAPPALPLLVDAGKRGLSSALEGGRQKMLDGAYQGAIQQFTAALQLRPGLTHAIISRGFCYLTLGDYEKARRDFAEVIAKDSGFNRNIYVLIALCFKRSGDYKTAIRYLSRGVAQFVSFKAALIARGELSLKVRDFEKARADFRQVLQDAPMHLVARRGLGDALRGLGNFREALRQYSKAIEDTLNQRQNEHMNRGQKQISGIHHEHGHHEDTDSGTDGDCTSSGNSPPATSRVQTGLVESSSMDSSFKREASIGRCDAGKGVEAQVSKMLPEALIGMEDDSDQRPEDLQGFLMEVLLRRALLLRLTGDFETAGEDLLEVLQMDPQNGLALFWYGKVLLEQNRHKEAPSWLQASIQHNEATRHHAHALLGAMHMTWSIPNYDAALRHLKEASRLFSKSEPIKATLLICLGAAALNKAPRNAAGAIQMLDKALALLSQFVGAPGPGASITGNATPPSGSRSARVAASLPAGSGGAAAVALSARSSGSTAWGAAKAVVRRRQALAQGDDLDQAMECTTYLQLVAKEPQQQAADIPPLLYSLRTMALTDLGRWEEVLADCRRALAIDPHAEATTYTMHIAGGIIRSRNKEFEAAVGCFTKAIRLQPVNADARLYRAVALTCAARALGAGRDPPLTGGSSGSCTAVVNKNAARAQQLLGDAVSDLQAVEQQALIADAALPVGTRHLLAACLCGLGRPQDAWETLSAQHNMEGCSMVWPAESVGPLAEAARQRCLEAEVLSLLGRHHEAIEACTALLAMQAGGHVEARLMRGRCWSELGEAERAFEDYREAVVLEPDRADLHEASGELFLMHRCAVEAVTALSNAMKLQGSPSSRLAYKRALAHLLQGSISGAFEDLNRALRLSPGSPVMTRARDGVLALQALVDGDFRCAHVRLNILLHTGASSGNAMSVPSEKRIPTVFLPHEVCLYRGVAALYLGETTSAIQDLESAVVLAQQVFASESSDTRLEAPASTEPDQEASSPSSSSSTLRTEKTCSRQGAKAPNPQRRPCPEVSTRQGLERFECEVLYNIVLCHLVARDYQAALATCEHMLHKRPEALSSLGPPAQCLAWFLVGCCYLALGDAGDEAARTAFNKSYSFDPVYVDDFLRRHGCRHEPSAPSTASNPTSRYRPVGGPPPALRPASNGLRAPAAGTAREVCDAAPEAICCLRHERSRLSFWLPPCRLPIGDVIVWGRPSAAWPFVRPPELWFPRSLTQLDLLQQREILPLLNSGSHYSS